MIKLTQGADSITVYMYPVDTGPLGFWRATRNDVGNDGGSHNQWKWDQRTKTVRFYDDIGQRDVRGAGLLASVELVADKELRSPIEARRQEIADRVRDEEGVIVRSIYQNVIIAPCLVLTAEEADSIVEALRRVLATTGVDGRLVSAGAGSAG